MKKKFFASVLSICAAAILCAAEVTVADWNFTKSNVTKNKFPIILRGKSKITPSGMTIPLGAPKEPAGASTAKVYPVLSPDGAFSISVDFTLSSKEKRSGKNHVLLDCKYLPTTNAKQAAYNYGFMLLLKHTKNNIFIPTAAFGYQKHSIAINGKPLAITFDKPHNIKLVYNAKGTVTVILDKRTVASGKVQAGKIFPAKLPLNFGNRANADYWPLGGTIKRVLFTKTVIPPKKHRPGAVIASWTLVNQNVQKGKYPIKMRGGRITPAGMVVANRNPNIPSGAVLTKAHDDLSPQQGFEVNAEIVLTNTGKQIRTNPAMIFDSKYTPLNNHKGFMFYLDPQPRNRFRMIGAFGFGKFSVRVKSKEFAPNFGKVERVGMKFTSIGQVVFYFRGAELNTETVPPGKIAISDMAPALGDRIDKLYWPLIGTLKKVTIIAR